jgi:23S rRNA (adenine2030-N6)-methyltransferase
LQSKPGPLFVLDTHAGSGHYDLGGGPAQRSNEAASGIMRLLDVSLPCHGPVRPGDLAPHDTVTDPLEDYLAQVRDLGLYPGSPELISSLLRPGDRLACCERHPEEFANLHRLFRRDNRVAVHHRDGWEALKALLPPVQKRGLVLIDPPYEDHGEFTRLAEGLALARARFGTAVLAAWYPVKNRARERAFFDALTLRDVIACELLLREPLDPSRLNGCGMLVVNPPYRFEQKAQVILDTLLERLGNRETGEAALVVRLADE